jgi:hypothetical protein
MQTVDVSEIRREVVEEGQLVGAEIAEDGLYPMAPKQLVRDLADRCMSSDPRVCRLI